MSKAQFYDPKQLRAPGEIHFQDIDVCKYQKTVADELKEIGRASCRERV